MSNSFSGSSGALRGAFLRAMEDPDFTLQEDITSYIDKTNITPFYTAIVKRIRMTNALIGKCLDESGMSQADFCAEICCDKTQLNKVLKSKEDNREHFPRSLPFSVIENLCNRYDLNMSQLFLGKRMKIRLPRQYEMVLKEMSTLDESEQETYVDSMRYLSAGYLAKPNIMTLRDYEITSEEYRLFIGRRCRMYTDGKNMPPAYIIESGPIRRKATNLFEALNENPPVFLGRISIMMAICYTSHLPLEYFLIRDLSQPRLVKDIAWPSKRKPNTHQLAMLNLLCSTEQNVELQSEIISEVMVSNQIKVQV